MHSNNLELVYGKGPVLEVIENGNVNVNKVWLSDNLKDRDLKDRIVSFAKVKKIPCHFVPSEKINKLSSNKNNQGVVLSIAPIEYLEVSELIETVLNEKKSKTGSQVILVAHETEDTHNLGAMIRTFVAAGGLGVILTGRKNVGVNATVIKTSAGALFQAKFARHTNCMHVIDKLKENGFWIVGTHNDAESKSVFETDFPDHIAILVGNEHEGLNRLVKENCDFLLKIPISDKVDSLNVSVAFGITMFEYLRQKKLADRT